MDNPNIFMLQGNTIKLYRYRLSYLESCSRRTDINTGELVTETIPKEYFLVYESEIELETAWLVENGIPFTVEELDISAYTHLEGVTVRDWNEAEQRFKGTWVEPVDEMLYIAQYLTDLDYRLLCMEWGII